MKWANGDNTKSTFIYISLDGKYITDEANWPEIAQFHAVWSKNLCDAFVPYLYEKYGFDCNTQDTAVMLREWADQQDKVELNMALSGPVFTRFTTSTMSEILPKLEGAISSWGTEDHYFYEIWNNGKKCVLQLAINSKHIPDDYRRICDQINSLYPTLNKSGENWEYRMPYKGQYIKYSNYPDQEALFNKLTEEFEKVLSFEAELKKKMQDLGEKDESIPEKQI